MLLDEYHKKYYILRGFSTSLMLCNTLEKLNKVSIEQRSGGIVSISNANSQLHEYIGKTLLTKGFCG